METTLRKPESSAPLPIYILIIVMPFLMFYWIMPFVSNLMLGTDFQYSLHQQLEILFAIKTGTFPLYDPGYALGQSSVVVTWSQMFHPISHLASIMPGYWNGKALQWYTFFKLLSLGPTQLFLFIFLRKLRLNILFSFLISFITVYNLRMLDLFRFGAALEAYTGYLLLCTSIGWYFVRPHKFTGPLSIIISTYLLVVSGHPQHMYYGCIGAGMFLLVTPFFLSNILGRDIGFNRALLFWVRGVSLMTIGILLSSVYIFPFIFDFLPTNSGRADAAYDWSVAYIGLFEMFNNFFTPVHSDVHHAFGGSSIILLALLTPLLRFFKVKIPRSVWVVWGIVCITLIFILGDMTPVYKWVWEYLPLLSTFRHQGRITIILPTFFMLLLIWIVKAESPSFKLRGIPVELNPRSILAVIALLLIPVYLFLFFYTKPDMGVVLIPSAFNHISLWVKFLIILFGAASLIGLILNSINWRASRMFGVFLLLMTVLQVGIILRHGTFVEPLKPQPTLEEMKAQKIKNLDYWSAENINMNTATVIKQLERSFLEPFLGKVYSQIIPVKNQDDAFDRMQMERTPQQLFIEGYDIGKAKIMSEGAAVKREDMVQLVYSSFNRMKFRAVSQTPALFGFSYPYSEYWSAWVNGVKAHVYQVNGAAQAVEIPAGKSFVEFRYWSDAYFWGMVFSCATFAIVGLFICARTFNGLSKLVGIAFIIALSGGIMLLWYNSLYSGDNLKTEYTWKYSPPLKIPNLAYGKKTSGFDLPRTLLRFHFSKVVDGDTRPGSGFILYPANDTGLIVDLNRSEKIGSIVLFGNFKTKPEISLSEDSVQWQRISFITLGDNENAPLRIIFRKPDSARFIKVRVIDSAVGIDELEVYGPENL
jgi:hypothetical protein